MFSNKRSRRLDNVACIFVHAGAGYHSLQNENIHLQACNDAAKAAMAVMRNGGCAVDAVEIAVKVLEDREITNAGYGSNLALDGVVECDAVVVDHFGRSGAAGAVAQIKNPISLARLVLDHSTRTLSLRRVPPNLLVGQGATEFAYEHGMPVLPLDCLVSPAARERWRRWRDDLDRAERNHGSEQAQFHGVSPSSSDIDLAQYYEYQEDAEQMRRAHTLAMRNGTWNEAQPISPPPSDDRASGIDANSSSPSPLSSYISMSSGDTSLGSADEAMDPYGPPGLEDVSKDPFANSTHQVATPSLLAVCDPVIDSDSGMVCESRHRSSELTSYFRDPVQHSSSRSRVGSRPASWQDGSSDSDKSDNTMVGGDNRSIQQDETRPKTGYNLSAVDQSTIPPSKQSNIETYSSLPIRLRQPIVPEKDKDLITDTVGAIAIDSWGNVACGASSGGIGMKHRGRIGPAALVGIGAAVIPPDPDDSERVTVATVTSGTGEHMGTTMAAGVCSERMYQSVRKVPGGGQEACGDDEALSGFIGEDFMGHPSVQNSNSAGAIGILTIKNTKDGAYLYYAHNTDSFALASMHADEIKPVCTMSRNKGNGSVAQGGRAIRYRRRRP